jgi:hypothetical protein
MLFARIPTHARRVVSVNPASTAVVADARYSVASAPSVERGMAARERLYGGVETVNPVVAC